MTDLPPQPGPDNPRRDTERIPVPDSGGRALPGPLAGIAGDDPRLLAAVGLVLAVLATLFGALLVGASLDDVGDDQWKATVKVIGLGGAFFGMSTGALLAGVALVLALVLAPSDSGRTTAGALVRFGAIGAAGWLALFVVLGVIVDLTRLGDDFVAAFGLLVADLGILALLLVVLLWAVGSAKAGRSA